MYVTKIHCLGLPFLLESFPGSSAGKESASNVEDLGSIPRSGRSPGEGNGYALQYSGLENSTDRGAWPATVHRVTKCQTGLSDFHFLFPTDFRYTEDMNVSEGEERPLPTCKGQVTM